MRSGERALAAALPAEQTRAEEAAPLAKHPESWCRSGARGNAISSGTEWAEQHLGVLSVQSRWLVISVAREPVGSS